jgi:hypothetical protein
MRRGGGGYSLFTNRNSIIGPLPKDRGNTQTTDGDERREEREERRRLERERRGNREKKIEKREGIKQIRQTGQKQSKKTLDCRQQIADRMKQKAESWH